MNNYSFILVSQLLNLMLVLCSVQLDRQMEISHKYESEINGFNAKLKARLQRNNTNKPGFTEKPCI